MSANHNTVAHRATAKPMRWTFVGKYGTKESAQVTASKVRSATIKAYTPRGAFEARQVGTKLSVRFRG